MAWLWSAYLSLWNFKLCTTCGLFWRKFHWCSVSSAVTVISAPSLTRNWMWVTAQADSPSCRTWQSTPGFPNLYQSPKVLIIKLFVADCCCVWSGKKCDNAEVWTTLIVSMLRISKWCEYFNVKGLRKILFVFIDPNFFGECLLNICEGKRKVCVRNCWSEDCQWKKLVMGRLTSLRFVAFLFESKECQCRRRCRKT